MHRLLTLAFFCLLTLTGYAQQAPTIEFATTSWAETLREAEASDKPVFLFAYTDFCHFCREMERDVFTDPGVRKMYNDTFLSYKINIDDGAAGEALGDELGITGFPTYVYFAPDGSMLHQSAAAKPAADFIQDARDALDPDKALFSLQRRYEAGERNPDLLFHYAAALTNYRHKDSPEATVVNEYLATQSPEQLSSEKNLRFLFEKDLPFSSSATQYLLAHHETFTPLYPHEEVAARVRSTIRRAAVDAGTEGNVLQFDTIKEAVQEYFSDPAPTLALAEIYYLHGKRDWLPYARATLGYAQGLGANDLLTLVETATYLKHFAEDREAWELGARIMQIAAQTEQSAHHHLLRAELLQQAGNTNQAIASAREALQLTTGSEEDRDAIAALIAEWEAAED